MHSQRGVLYLLVFLAGATTMAVEMCASRLLAPYFGSSLPVWGLLIGLLLAYLAIGNLLGGRLADRHPQPRLLYGLAAWTSFLIGLIPFLSKPVLRYAVAGLTGYQAGLVLGSLLSVLVLFAAPVILLGFISPFALRLRIEDAASSGNVAGCIYALSTAGSILGTFITVFLLIPSLGTQRAMLVISLTLLAVATIGLLQSTGRRAALYLLLFVPLLALHSCGQGRIKPTEGLVYETESAYNYIQVLRSGQDLLLKLNEGEGIQSAYRPGQVLTGYVYDYFLLVPFFRSEESSPPLDNLCLIGLAAGTSARQYTAVFGALPMDGVEIDPAIVEVAQRFFDLHLPNLHVAIDDGRHYVAHSGERYDVILIDAYCPPYIPFQLTTTEFFGQVHDHLTPDGVVAINVARTEKDYALVDAVASTLDAVFPRVYVMDTHSNLNSIVVATREDSDLSTVSARLAALTDPVLQDVASRAAGRVWEFSGPYREALTDDHAPVEQIVHGMVARYLLGH